MGPGGGSLALGELPRAAGLPTEAGPGSGAFRAGPQLCYDSVSNSLQAESLSFQGGFCRPGGHEGRCVSSALTLVGDEVGKDTVGLNLSSCRGWYRGGSPGGGSAGGRPQDWGCTRGRGREGLGNTGVGVTGRSRAAVRGKGTCQGLGVEAAALMAQHTLLAEGACAVIRLSLLARVAPLPVTEWTPGRS